MLLKDTIVLSVSGKINKEQYEKVLFELLSQRNKEIRKIILVICSEGGSISYAFAIYDLLKNIKVEIVTVALGDCIGAATLLFSLGNKRLVSDNVIYVLHFDLEVNCKENESLAAKFLKRKNEILENKVIEAIVATSNCSAEKISQSFYNENENFIESDELLELGIATDRLSSYEIISHYVFGFKLKW